MLVRELITKAWYLTGIVSRGFETVTGDQISDGLDLLNEILSEKSSDGRFIPNYARVAFDAVPGQQEYFIPDLVQVESLVVFLQTVRFPMIPVMRRQYWGAGRVENIESLPSTYYVERKISSDTHEPGTSIFVYFLPADQGYVFQVDGRFGLSQVTLDTVISNQLELFYLSYLRYKLAHRMCQWYSYDFGDDKMQTLFKLEAQVDDVNPIDTTVRKISQFPDQNGFNWADVTFHGWRP